MERIRHSISPIPHCIRLACKISMTQAQLTAVAGPFA